MSQIILRNLKIFFRDKSSVFFSLLAVFIIIGLYVLFLGDMASGQLEGKEDARFLMDSWIMAGLLAVTATTTTMGAFGIMVEDRQKKINKDFYCSPVKRTSIVGGYVVSTFIIGMIMSIIALILGELYIVSGGGKILPIDSLLKALGVLLLSVLSGSSMVALLVSFFKSQNAFSAASTVIGTMIGFLTGIYIPVGVLPQSVQTAIKLFPISHAAVLFRQIYTEAPISSVFAGAPQEASDAFKITMGIAFKWGDSFMSKSAHIAVLIISAVIFYSLAVYIFTKKKND